MRVVSDTVAPKPYTGIYSMHKYWSKKPYNIVSQYIQRYSKSDDVVLDAFCGSGISNIESILLKRKTIGMDINPMAITIANQMISNIDISRAEAEFEMLEKMQAENR